MKVECLKIKPYLRAKLQQIFLSPLVEPREKLNCAKQDTPLPVTEQVVRAPIPIPKLTAINPIKNRIPNMYQNEIAANAGDNPVKIAVPTAKTMITIFPPYHSANVPPKRDVAK